MKNLKVDRLIIPSVLFVFVIRFLFSYLPSFGFDMDSWFGWAYRLASLGPAGFYSDSDWTQYTPGYLYYLWAIGKIGIIKVAAIKIPTILADIVTGMLIWSLVRKINKKLALPAFFLYTLNPVVIFNGSVWGQIDGILTLFLFLSAYLLIERKNFLFSILSWSVAFLIKPQSVAILPALIAGIFIYKIKFKKVALGVLASIVLVLLLSWPFFPEKPLFGLPLQIIKMSDYYSYTSVFAFNIWTWFGSWNMSNSDKTLFLNLPLSIWGGMIYLASVVWALISFKRKITKKQNYYLLFAVLSLCFFLFPTKIHERYNFPFFSFLLAAAALSKSVNLFVLYGITSVGAFLNTYYSYSYFYPNQLKSEFLYKLSEGLAKLIGLMFLGTYLSLLFLKKIPELKFSRIVRKKNPSVMFAKSPLPKKSVKIALWVILIFALTSRILSLGNPKKEYFDEVYHAFTAKVMMHEDKAKAWEWWNAPPPGFAYEWTHPPLAKLAMVLGMKIFGENSFGYRFPGAVAGTLTVFLVYLIAKNLFKDETVGLLSAGIFSLDGLPLVMSRIGMNDAYLLLFVLLSIYFFMKGKNFWSALSFALAISSKWSAVWAIPILGILWLKRKNKFGLSNLWFLLLPPAVYLLTYLPMFLTGHDFSVWWEMQKQMWWYHTGLKATHPYTSSWWSWPLLLRPVYLYTSEEVGGMVARIYTMGNPLVFWFGLASIFTGFLYAYTERNKNLGFVIFSYLIFFVPWAASPRIMFFYHYLPSVPFMCIAAAYVLRRNPKIIIFFLVLSTLSFIYFYPHFAGLRIPLWLDKSYYWIPSWR